eukprot:CAMPEP_0185277216 /NCGR_PEP_ID=MMETSP1359-20130426/58093_1 /TAXON_ID=552665 /ORGANISM="Bigelowiella longifila, Strain CCMP242" /LENGTH=69 /DNA_ID=CAMNT_0027871251 /DNA_START=750 /DNA_END=959 /DNA_ORIENTATION=+
MAPFLPAPPLRALLEQVPHRPQQELEDAHAEEHRAHKDACDGEVHREHRNHLGILLDDSDERSNHQEAS